MKRQKGFGLVELMIVVAVIGVLAALSEDMMTTYMLNMKVRSTAEALKEVAVLSRAEAIKRNDTIRLTFSGGGGWLMEGYVNDVIATLKSKADASGSKSAVTPANTVIRFDGTGRSDADAVMDIKPTTGSCADVTCLSVQITRNGKIKICNPSATNEVLKCA
jgi:prepilin-type N-terminal cleavage/methylation domain-containing protein